MAQAVQASEKAGGHLYRTVISRRNRQEIGESLVTMRLDDFLNIYRWYRAQMQRLRSTSDAGK